MLELKMNVRVASSLHYVIKRDEWETCEGVGQVLLYLSTIRL